MMKKITLTHLALSTVIGGLFSYHSISLAMPEIKENIAIPKSKPDENISLQQNNAPKSPITLHQLETLDDPEKVRQLINRIIDAEQWDLLPPLINYYVTFKQKDQILIDYASGILLQRQNKYKQAILLYRKIIADHPNYQPVRFRLAQMLFEDQQNEAALDQFRKLQSEPLPLSVNQVTQQYIEALQKRDAWKVNFGITYLRENNVNNASKSEYIYLGNLKLKKSEDALPKSANGLSYYLNLAKAFNLFHSHYLYVENQFSGKTYWNNHKYDDLNNRTSLGYQYQNYNTRFALLPFYEKRWYGNKPYNKGYGLRLETDYWFNTKWQISLANEWQKLKYIDEEAMLNGYSFLNSATVVYLINAKTGIYPGIDYFTENTKDKALSSNRLTFRFGWGQEWWKGVSTRIQVHYSQRKFKRLHTLYPIVRNDNEKGISITLWHRNFHFYGITPKVTYSYNKVSSNIADLYSNKKQKVYLSFEKTF